MGKTITPFDTGIRIESLELAETEYKDITVWLTKYAYNDQPALLLTTEHPDYGREQLAIVSVTVSALMPVEGAIFVKNYSENAGVLEQLQSLHLLEPTGREEHSGWITVPEARFVGDLAEAFERFKAVAY